MANKFTDTDNYQAIANAIRRVNGSSNTYTPPQMASAILGLDNRTTLSNYMGFTGSTFSTIDLSLFIPSSH